MTLRNLQVFVKVAECGKMSTAAKQLFVSQSSVSQAISEIEREFNIVLFNRIGKQLYITPLGEELLVHARKAIAYQESITAWLTQNSRVMKLRVGASATVGTTILSEILRRLEEECPGIDVFAYVGNTESITEKLMCGELDIALVEGKVNAPHLESQVIMHDQLVLICSRNHRFCGRSKISIRELENEKFLLREHGSGTRAQIVDTLERYGISYSEKWECSHSEAIKRGVMDGHGISVISQRLIQKEFCAGEIWACGIEEIPIKRSFSLVSYSGKIPTESMRMFTEVVNHFVENEKKFSLID